MTEIDGPWWGVRTDYSSARVAQTVAAAMGGVDIPLTDFVITWDADDNQRHWLSWDEAVSMLEGFAKQ